MFLTVCEKLHFPAPATEALQSAYAVLTQDPALAQAARLFRLGFTILGAFAGLFGVTVGFVAMLIHLAGLTSLEVPYLRPLSGGGSAGLLRRPTGREEP